MSRQRRFRMVVVALIGASSICCAPRARAEGFPSGSWTIEEIPAAVEHGTALIEKCLRETKYRYDCSSTPLEACETDHGTSMREMTDCAEVARLSWKRLHDETLDKIDQIETGGRFGPPEQVVRELLQSNAKWEDWFPDDCRIRVSTLEGGSIYNYAYRRCLANGYSKRTVDLIAALEDMGH